MPSFSTSIRNVFRSSRSNKKDEERERLLFRASRSKKKEGDSELEGIGLLQPMIEETIEETGEETIEPLPVYQCTDRCSHIKKKEELIL